MLNCPSCAGHNIKQYRSYEVPAPKGGQVFHMDHCQKCKLVFTSPKPSKELLSFLYSDNSYYSYQKIYIPEQGKKKGPLNNIKRWLKAAVIDHYYGYGLRRENYKANLWLRSLGIVVKGLVKDDVVYCGRIIPFVKNGRHLDVGCGSGSFVYWMTENGWNSCGIELNNEAVEIASGLKLNVREGDLETAGHPENYFDLITAWEVLEHIPDLKQFLSEVRRILKPGGKFAGSVPNIVSWEALLFGKDWQPLEIPYHLYHFSPESLKTVLEGSGMKLEKLEFLKITHSWNATLEKKFGRDSRLLPFLRLLGRMFYLLSNIFGYGARLKFVAVKQN